MRADEVVYGLEIGAEAPPHSWFVAFAEPAGAPPCGLFVPGRLAVAAVVPRGGAGSGAGLQVVQGILKAAAELGFFEATPP